MSWEIVLLIAVGLAMDAFSVALGVGATVNSITGRHLFRLSFHFGLFQFLMPLVGWLAGETLVAHIGGWDHWIAFGLLLLIGGRMVWSSLHPEKSDDEPGDPTRGMSLVALSVATSLDALAVGLSLAALGVGVFYPSVVIGVVAAALTLTGMLLGKRLGEAFGRRVGVLGGLVLIGVGVKILADHL